jgi:hypothetical protein
MASRTWIVLGAGISLLLPSAAKAEADDAGIARITGLATEVQGDVVRVSAPRSDLHVEVDGLAMTPFQGFTSWAAFQRVGEETMLMGDIVATEREADAALGAALDAGLEVTALHNHFFFEKPRVFFMHIGGMGPTETLARGVKATLDAVKAASAGSHEAGFGGPAIPTPSHIEPAPLEEILGARGVSKDGMVKFVIGRSARMHGTEVGSAMGVNTWAVFSGAPEAAAVDGDFAMLEGELQPVLKALHRGGIHVVAIHNHMTHEEPRFVFLHYWGKGRATDLARVLKTALDTQGR